MKKYKESLKEENNMKEYVFDYILDLDNYKKLDLLFTKMQISTIQYQKALNFIQDEDFFN
jgi:hypothetical protein